MPKIVNDSVLFKCTSCYFEEFIPLDAVVFFDIFDPNNPDSPPACQCQSCSGIMIPAD